MMDEVTKRDNSITTYSTKHNLNLMVGVDTKFCSWNVRGVHHPVKRKENTNTFEKERGLNCTVTGNSPQRYRTY